MDDRPPSPVSRTVVAAFIAIAATYVALASLEFLLTDMQVELGFSSEAANALGFLSTAAALLIVFVAGSLSDRWGARRCLIASGLVFTAGAVVVGLAPSVAWIAGGLILLGVGGAAMAIVALSAISLAVREPKRRATVFGIYAALSPAMFIVAPPMTALIASTAGWRAGTVPWVAFGLIAILASWHFIPDARKRGRGEIVTPILAGMVLAGLALAATSLPSSQELAWVLAGVAVVALIALVVAMRRLSSPTLRLRWWSGRGTPLLLIAVVVAAMPNLFFYTDLLLQYRYAVPLVTITLLLVIPQFCAVLGGLLSGPVSARIGPTGAAVVGLLASAAASMITLVVTPQSPILVPVAALAIAAIPISFVVGPLAELLFSRAPEDSSGSASSTDEAAWNTGGVLGGALFGALALGAFQSRLTDVLQASGVPFGDSVSLAERVRSGEVVDALVRTLADGNAREALVSKGPALLEAQSHAFAVLGVASACLYLLAGLLMLLYTRRSPANV